MIIIHGMCGVWLLSQYCHINCATHGSIIKVSSYLYFNMPLSTRDRKTYCIWQTMTTTQCSKEALRKQNLAGYREVWQTRRRYKHRQSRKETGRRSRVWSLALRTVGAALSASSFCGLPWPFGLGTLSQCNTSLAISHTLISDFYQDTPSLLSSSTWIRGIEYEWTMRHSRSHMRSIRGKGWQ